MGEILELKNTINTMVDNLSTIISDVNSVMTLVGEGTLTRGVEVSAQGEFASMVDGINATIESLRGIVRELTSAGVSIGEASQNMISSGQEMNAMATQLSTAVEQIAIGAKNQAQLIAEASKESGGVGETATDTLTRVENMLKLFESANNVTKAGGHAMGETIKNTDLMLEGSKESVTRIDSLSKNSEKIQEIVNVIRDIATQTNILAINAAIEAVRAGKQGKGFAVVAEEVKTLSADSKNQAKDISTLVQAVLKETEATVETIKTMASNVELGRRSIGETSKSFTDINQSVDTTSKTAQEIATLAGAQKTSIDAISKSLDKVSGIAADTSTSGTQLAASSKDLLAKMQELNSVATSLADMSANLQQTVGRFELQEETQNEPEAAKRAAVIAAKKRRTAASQAPLKTNAVKTSVAKSRKESIA
jgi:methyl-accepting chemotaxis protein